MINTKLDIYTAQYMIHTKQDNALHSTWHTLIFTIQLHTTQHILNLKLNFTLCDIH